MFKKVLEIFIILTVFLTCAHGMEVTIQRDTYGVPHITGETEETLFYGFGYAQAEDHLLDMEMNLLQATGRLSEAFGAGENDENINSDFEVRLFKIPQVAEEKYYQIEGRTRGAIESFVEGINDYINEHRYELPDWVEEVRSVDVVAMARYYDSNNGIQMAYEKLGKGSGRPITSASNSWVISSQRSATGSVMLHIHPHVPWMNHFQKWYEAHLKLIDSSFDVVGATHFGIPFIIMGHNAYLAWAPTHNTTQVADVYEERLAPSNPLQYLYIDNGKITWKDITVINETIPVKDGGGITYITREFYYTHHGPVMKYDPANNRAYSARLSMIEEVDELTQLFRMNESKNLDEFKAALQLLQIDVYSVIYGDVFGNIYYLWSARCPIRSKWYDWSSPVPGWLAETEWQGIIPFNDLPQLENPTCGFLQSCNNSPQYVTPDHELLDSNYPDYLVTPAFGWRAQRATALLNQNPNFTVAEMKEMSFDNYVLVADDVLPLLERAYLEKDPLIPDPNYGVRKEAIILLMDWDRYANKVNREMMLFNQWFNRYQELDPRITLSDFPSPDEMTDEDMELAIYALDDAETLLLGQYGTIEVEWGSHHVIERGKNYPLSGGGTDVQTLHLAAIDSYQDGIGYCTYGSSYMMQVNLSQPIRAYSIKPLGQSEDPQSPHYADLTELFSQDQYKRAWKCSAWPDVIESYNFYVSGEASWNDVIACYQEYASHQ